MYFEIQCLPLGVLPAVVHSFPSPVPAPGHPLWSCTDNMLLCELRKRTPSIHGRCVLTEANDFRKYGFMRQIQVCCSMCLWTGLRAFPAFMAGSRKP